MDLFVDEIILQIRKGNEEAVELLFLCLEKNIIQLENKMLYYYYAKGITREDIRQMIKSDTMNIVKIYDIEKSHFFAFWKMAEQQNICHWFQRIRDEGNIPMLSDEEMKMAEYHNFNDNFEKDYWLRDEYDDCLNIIEKERGEIDRNVLYLWSQGYSYEEIAEKYNIKKGAVNYIINKAFSLLRERKKQ